MWIKVSAEEARRHPLFGVKGILLFVGCLMILVLLSPLLQIISKEMAGRHNPHFVPSVGFIILIIATWGLFRRKAYVRPYVYSLAVLTMIGFVVLFFFTDVPYLPFRAEDALLGLIIQDVPLCSYFTWSRRARVTLECRVRSDDPFLSKRDVPGIQNAAPSAGKAEPLVVPAVDANHPSFILDGTLTLKTPRHLRIKLLAI